jgi:signal transduction histidine kinase
MLANQRAASRELSLDATHAADVLVQEVLAHRATAGISESIVREHIAPATVRADRDAVRVIIENLLDNARKYGGARMRIRAECSVDRWALSVSDAGSGFAPRDADALFDPFARNSRTGATHGSGLGLTISRQLARKMGGDLEASSEGPGQGATFTLSLPLADRRTAAAVATQARHA